ncbi:ROK family protein [Nocardioides perillae]|uniref:Glucokinase n=1 Tax=Nocardioides perillae TaxID=1119534 RepID=A0A7Y9RX46_9ACTN|nr:glucokinase [Nocardioides perillae]
MNPGCVVGVDVGGTKVVAGVVVEGRVQRVARRATPGRRVDVRLVEAAVVEAVREAAGGEPLAAVGVAAAGFVDAAGEHVVFAPHLPWRGEPVRTRFSELLGVPVVLENDATAAAYAEATSGAARGLDPALVVTLGTGIGGGVVVGGRVVRGASGMAGEFGHAQVVPEGRPCECGGRGCWEQYCSGRALVRADHEQRGGASDPLTGPQVTTAAAAGDPAARHAFEEVGTWLGVGLANLAAALDPAVLVVGGGVSAAGDLLLDPARAALERALVGAAHRRVPPVVRAVHGPEAGLVGAAALAAERYRR